ncbi:unnamed protein product [Pylaiella littoralis]
MNEEDVAQYWEAQAEEWDEKENGSNIANALQTIAADSDHLLRGATTAAALAVARRFCTHETPPPPLPKMTNLGKRRAAAKQHPGLCGVHHAQFIGNISYDAVVERARGVLITTKTLRNQACYEAGTGLNATGPGVQLKRQECFTKACRAVWPGDEPLQEAVVAAFLR